ncbi:energy-coupling factor transporter transmembrane protein EcfT [Alkalibaculum sp. M08DMB]|uniref:Energy-coupling factor transporter transmembrane protein EcfT n=1 Tax=Alkalibaculum sporogenes TaxID=2655001 RepID=A0A6A7K7U0_9FIRM|nr:energy-coupling factor transporter transmembrane component T [Alkalibaculum sporogenes]MPW25490.1 energy-coupling factor transporter transmembrane protein EcfT [Alkalibaculum sporogenes]
MHLDIRAKLLLLLTVSISSFIANSITFEISMVILISIIQLLSCKDVFNYKLVLTYTALVLAQLFLLPVLPSTVAMITSIPVVRLRIVFPLFMVLLLIISTTKVSQLIATMTKMNIPKSITITLAVTLRYFPSIGEEFRHIHDAMSMRKIDGFIQKIECYCVPLLISASKTADELTAAAITRGIDNPTPGTYRGYQKLAISDYIVMVLSLLLIMTSISINLGIL